MGIRITRATNKDARTVAKLNDHVHQKHVEAVPAFFKQKTLAEAQEIFEQILSLDNAYVFVAWNKRTPVGYTIAFVQYREETPFTYARQFVIIDQISVNPNWKGQGIGRKLVDEVLKVAIDYGIDEIDASTWSFNTEAMGFLDAFGFQPQLHRFTLNLQNQSPK